MKIFRIAAGILAAFILALMGYLTLFSSMTEGPNSLGELVYLVFGIPILVLNLWAWAEPEIIEVYFLGKDKLK